MSLKDLVRPGPAPHPPQSREPSINPIHINDVTWFYPQPKGLHVVHEVRDKERYIRTDEFIIKWSDVNNAVKQRERLRKVWRHRSA